MTFSAMRTDDECKKLMEYVKEGIQMICSTCGSQCIRRERNGREYKRCHMKFCKREESLFKGTILEGAKIDYITILKIIRYWFCNVPRKSIAELLRIQSRCVTNYLLRAQKMVETRYYNSLEKIGGPGVVVKVYESKLGKRKYHREPCVDGCWVLEMVERTPERRIVIIVVPNRKADTLISTMRRYLHPDSVIDSNFWCGPCTASNSSSSNVAVNHSVSFADFITGVHTNSIEGNWDGLKQGVPVQKKTKNRICMSVLRYIFKKNSVGDPSLDFIKYLF